MFNLNSGLPHTYLGHLWKLRQPSPNVRDKFYFAAFTSRGIATAFCFNTTGTIADHWFLWLFPAWFAFVWIDEDWIYELIDPTAESYRFLREYWGEEFIRSSLPVISDCCDLWVCYPLCLILSVWRKFESSQNWKRYLSVSASPPGVPPGGPVLVQIGNTVSQSGHYFYNSNPTACMTLWTEYKYLKPISKKKLTVPFVNWTRYFVCER